jgi:uncharacterized protein YecE (DUF72 family)
MEIRIGAGGWGYFQVSGFNKLSAYARAFDFVEVNSTFYKIPNIETVKSWRKKVYDNFQFSVRCHRSITHDNFFEPINDTFDNFDKMIEICNILKSNFLHFLTPAKAEFTKERIKIIRDFLSSINTKGIKLAWEIRGYNTILNEDIKKILIDFNITHSIDLSLQIPNVNSEFIYTRLFGKGYYNRYQFTDKELKLVDDRIKISKIKKALVIFHGVRMYKDAGRYKIFRKTGDFPMVTKNLGAKSLEEVLKQDAKFPATKKQLIRHQGWKIIDLSKSKRVHATYYLEKIPDKEYEKIEDIIKELN